MSKCSRGSCVVSVDGHHYYCNTVVHAQCLYLYLVCCNCTDQDATNCILHYSDTKSYSDTLLYRLIVWNNNHWDQTLYLLWCPSQKKDT